MIPYPGHNLASAGLIEPKLTARMTGRAKNAKVEIVAHVHPWNPGMIEYFTLDDSNGPGARVHPWNPGMIEYFTLDDSNGPGARVHPWSPGMIEYFTLDDSNRPRAYWGTSILIALYSAYYTNLLF